MLYLWSVLIIDKNLKGANGFVISIINEFQTPGPKLQLGGEIFLYTITASYKQQNIQ